MQVNNSRAKGNSMLNELKSSVHCTIVGLSEASWSKKCRSASQILLHQNFQVAQDCIYCQIFGKLHHNYLVAPELYLLKPFIAMQQLESLPQDDIAAPCVVADPY